MNTSDLTRARESLDAAFAGHEGFVEALDIVAAAAGAKGAAIIPLAADNTHRAASHAIQDLADAYNAHWHMHDFRFASVGKMLRTGIAVDQDIISPEGMARLPYYTEYLARYDLQWFAGVPFRDGSEVWCLALQRTPRQGFFNADEQDELRRLGCMLSQTVATARLHAAARDGGLLDGLDAARNAALILDRRCRVLVVNDSVTDELKRELRVQIGHPLLGASPLFEALKGRVAALLGDVALADDTMRLPLLVPRAGRQPLVVRLRALRGAGSRFYERASILAIVDEIDRHDARSVDLLVHLFGLTRGQARVASLIGAGQTIAQCAHTLRIDVETVRSALQRTFQKMGIKRQAELVQIISQIPSLRT